MRYRHSLVRLAIAVAISLGTLFWVQAPVLAAPFTVNNNGDASDSNPGDAVCATAAGTCTLRAAIEEANARAGADTITIPPMTIAVSQELEVTQDVTIAGAGEAQTVIDGNNATRVFHFALGSAGGAIDSVSNLTIRNAKTTAASDPNDRFKAGLGGAILNEAGQLTLSHVTLTGNQAEQGAGVYNTYRLVSGPIVHKLVLSYVTVSNNHTTSTATYSDLGAVGGGVFNGSQLDADHVTITGNSSIQGGGLFNNSYENATLTTFTISENTARIGGGVMNDLGPLIDLRDGVVSQNVSQCCDTAGNPSGGAGISNNKADEFGVVNLVKLTNVQVIGNVSQSTLGYGGGIANIKNMELANVLISGNQATYGAGVFNGNAYVGISNNMIMLNTTVSGNVGDSASDSSGAGIFNTTNGNLTLNNVTVTANWAAAGGGFDNRTAMTVHNSIVAGNTAELFGSDCRGKAISTGHNIVGSGACLSAAKSGDQVIENPLLGALRDNGGGTLTHAPLSGSPAIDRGGTCPSTDQRGSMRPVDGDADGQALCDAGAVEVVAYQLTSLSPGRAVTSGSSFTLSVRGTGFRNGLRVQWNGSDRTTTFVSTTELQATISAGDIGSNGVIVITVSDPNQRGALANSLKFYVGPPLQPRSFLPRISKADD